ncbi:MAG: adenine deaminase [Bacteroidetes bacterium]|nr:MAG: adenine deaminase [Bacteroidota bacterium]
MEILHHISGQLLDVHQRRILPARVHIAHGRISEIRPEASVPDQYILPGFVDAHIHIESSMLVPHEFARIALCHGTVATVSDPHEIANVLGVEGVQYMIDQAREAQLKFHFGAPSCVPATAFETAGARIGPKAVAELLASDDIYYLAEMMNYPGVLAGDEEVMQKIAAAKAAGKPVDGHAPGLRGPQARQYIAAGISTDHECFELNEALDKLQHGMKILIREGSAAKNYQALHPLIGTHPQQLMFCSDDKHPDDLLLGHINELVLRSLAKGYELFDVMRIASVQPVQHYGLPVGLLRKGDPADFIVVNNLREFAVQQTVINGRVVAAKGQCYLPQRKAPVRNRFAAAPKKPEDFAVYGSGKKVAVIVAVDGQLITESMRCDLPTGQGRVLASPEKDILKISVINRYQEAAIASGFIKNFGLKAGAIASTVAHDSHNLLVLGTDDHWMCQAANLLIEQQGGLAAVGQAGSRVLPLPIAGLMSGQDGREVGRQYAEIDAFVKQMGCTLKAPFMSLSFMALLVIPKLKMSDLGLFDAVQFRFADLMDA